jgi:phenylpropionate dioxygenase-like ring-hydroxylating dioxygenase large terminal subunit
MPSKAHLRGSDLGLDKGTRHQSARPRKLNRIRNVIDYIHLPLIYDHWYVAGLRGDFSRSLVAKTILNRSIVFFRQEDGNLRALQNRCAHRSFPLSESKLVGDTIRCGYHGIRYAATGRIIDVPCQTSIPTRTLKRYSVLETGPFVWIWMGAGDADVSKIPDMTAYTNEEWTFCAGTLPIEGSYLLMVENLCDLSHLPFLHATTFGAPESIARCHVELEIDKDKPSVCFYRTNEDWDEAKFTYPATFDYRDRALSQRFGGRMDSPGYFCGLNHLQVLDAKPEEQRDLIFYIDHFLTPATSTTMHYYYAYARNFALADHEFTSIMESTMKLAFAEDAHAVKAMQTLLETDHTEFNELMISGDKASLAVRAMMLEFVEREADVMK